MKRILQTRLLIASAVVLATWVYVLISNNIGMAYLNQEHIVAIRILEAFLALHWLMLALPALGIWLAFRTSRSCKKLLLYSAPELLVAAALLWAMTGHTVWLLQTTTPQYGPLKHWRMIQQEKLMQNSPAGEPGEHPPQK